MKNRFSFFAAVCMAAVAVALVACDKDDARSVELTGRIASYYGVVHGEGAIKVLNVCSDGEWVHWPQVAGLDYEQGYEYEVRVRMDPRKDLEGMMDVMFGYDLTCLEVIGKVARHTDDCPLASWDEYLEGLEL